MWRDFRLKIWNQKSKFILITINDCRFRHGACQMDTMGVTSMLQGIPPCHSNTFNENTYLSTRLAMFESGLNTTFIDSWSRFTDEHLLHPPRLGHVQQPLNPHSINVAVVGAFFSYWSIISSDHAWFGDRLVRHLAASRHWSTVWLVAKDASHHLSLKQHTDLSLVP